MESKTLIAVLAVVIVVISLVNISVTVVRFGEIRDGITGYATTGYVNLTVSSNIILNVSPSTTNWGSGIVNATGGFNNATLTTVKDSTATVVGGNWSTNGVNALAIQNLGSVNVSLNITSDKTAATFIKGDTVTPVFQWNFTNKDANACVDWNATTGVWHTVTTNQTPICDIFQYGAGKNEIWVDTRIVIPDNSPPEDKAATFTVTGIVAV